MQLSNAPGKLLLPFANAGAKNTIPTASQIGITAGAASLTDGFPPLTRTPIAAGGVPPSGLDMNGILYALSAALRWANAGGGYVYDSAFAADSNVGGYPKGARVLRSDGAGYWLNTIDGNTVDPESVTVNAAQVAGWVPDLTNGIAAITMTSANVTLTPAQYGKPIIVLSGVLTANLNLIFPNLAGEWTVVNNCTGAFTVTAKTAAGTGAVVTPGRTRIIWGDGTNIAGAMNEVETPAQFDATTKIATMAAVQRALGSFAGYDGYNTNSVLTQGVVGKLVNMTAAGAAYTLTMPATAGLPDGASFVIQNTSGRDNAIARQGADNLTIGGSNLTSLWVRTGESAILTKVGSFWFVSGSAALTGAASFAKSFLSDGYQKLPSGLIIQWGLTGVIPAGALVNITLPIAFPTAFLQMGGTPTFQTSAQSNWKASSATATTLTLSNSGGQPDVLRWHAIGY